MAAVQLVAAVVGLAVLLGGAVAVLFFFSKKNTQDFVRQENVDVKARLETVEKAVVEAKAAEAACQVRLVKAEATIATLTEVFSGNNAVIELKALVDTNHQVVMAKLEELHAVAS